MCCCSQYRFAQSTILHFVLSFTCFFYQEDISEIFKAADRDNSGTLTTEEFRDVIEDIVIRYPQVELYLKSKHLFDVVDIFKDSEGNDREEIDIEWFKLALTLVDTQMKSLPATAQVLIFISSMLLFPDFYIISQAIHPLEC